MVRLKFQGFSNLNLLIFVDFTMKTYCEPARVHTIKIQELIAPIFPCTFISFRISRIKLWIMGNKYPKTRMASIELRT
jgi:hypothetical protein